MNGTLVPTAVAAAHRAEFEALVSREIRSWKDLLDWGRAERLRLAATTPWIGEGTTLVPLLEWFARFPNTPDASEDAFQRFMERTRP
jgi:hypothetical protein